VDLHAYLKKAVRNKILRRVHKERRHAGGLPEAWKPVSREPAFDSLVERKELAASVRAWFPAGDCRLLDLWALGLTWPEIAGQVGGDPSALRVRLARVIAKVRNDVVREE
jgi:hypothetical protein